MKILLLSLVISVSLMSCNKTNENVNNQEDTVCEKESIFIPGTTVKTRYEVPKGFHRVEAIPGTFAEYLQNLPLKPAGYETHLYDGTKKENKVSSSVVDLDIDPVDLQQCADAIIRLRAEYLYKTKQYDKIHFNFTNGFRCDYNKWAQGYRIKVNGNTTSWYKAQEEDYSYNTFRKYLLQIFQFAGTASLAKELEDISPEEFGIGTIIITPGYPGHAVIVVDMIVKDDYRGDPYGKMGVLLAQSYMPAQEIEILNGNHEWLDCKEGEYENIWTSTPKGECPINTSGGSLFTAEYIFYNKQLKQFKE